MQKAIKYTIFKTKWGYFGLAGTESKLLRTCLPLSSPEKVEFQLLKDVRATRLSSSKSSSIESDKNLFKSLQKQIIAYFEGVCVNFSPDIPVLLDGFSEFQKAALAACRGVRFGQTVTYVELARKSGRPAAARTVGNALAKNPLPLIVPCHRVIRSDGQVGGFSAPGGKTLKIKLLKHEQLVEGTIKTQRPCK